MGLLKAGIGALSGVLADSWRDYFYCESLDADMTIAIYENPYSFDNENWVTLWLKSGGADNMRSVKLRKKPSTG